jgi:hypothetical protein
MPPMKLSVQAFLNGPVGSFLKVFVAVTLGAFLGDLAGLTEFSDVFSQWQGWFITGLVSAVPILINWLNPADPRYGRRGPFTAD